jgi:hypothetical protein
MSDNQEIRFARLERAPAYKNVLEARPADLIADAAIRGTAHHQPLAKFAP